MPVVVIEPDDRVIIDPEEYDELITENERLREEVRQLKVSGLERDCSIREEVMKKSREMLEQIQAEWK